jgi:DNA repair exonuclease SbcCD ATPase subunit
MTDITQTSTVQASSRVTLEDVRKVLEDTDPNQTNASKIRARLGGRGSFETIQKHLATLREELATAAAPPVAAHAVPPVPTEAVNQIWVAAWTAAQAATMARAERLANERDAALLKLETTSQDLVELVTNVDEQAEQLVRAAASVAKVQADHMADVERLQAEHRETIGKLDEAQRLVEYSRQDLAKEKAEAQHAAQLAEAGRVMMREELARLTDTVGELKSHLYKRAEAASAVTVI